MHLLVQSTGKKTNEQKPPRQSFKHVPCLIREFRWKYVLLLNAGKNEENYAHYIFFKGKGENFLESE